MSRVSGFANRLCKITNNSSYPKGKHYSRNVINQTAGHVKVWESPDRLPKHTYFHIVPQSPSTSKNLINFQV